MQRLNLDVLGVVETYWTNEIPDAQPRLQGFFFIAAIFGRHILVYCFDMGTRLPDAFEENGFTILHPCRNDNIHRQGVGIILSQQAATYLI